MIALRPQSRNAIISGAAFFVPLGVYLFSMQRFVGFWDVGEMQTVPYILGIAHPTGFPAFTILGWIFTHVLPVGNVAWRTTAMCALAMSATAWLVNRFVLDETGEPLIAMLSGWMFAFTLIAWTCGTRTEVHALAALFIAATLCCFTRWARTTEARWLYLGAAAWGLGIATHPVAALLGLGLFLIVLSHWETVSAPALGIAVAITAAIVVSFYAYLPARSAVVSAQRLDPTLALGVAPGRPFWDYDHPARFEGFVQLVSGSDFPVGDGLAAVFLPETYIKHGANYVMAAVENLTLAGALLVLAGGAFFLRRNALWGAGCLLAAGIGVPFALGYAIEADVNRYFLPSFIMGAALAGIGAATIAARWPRLRLPSIAALAAIAGVQFVGHSALLGQRFDPGATDFIAFVRANTPRDAILMAPWTYATPLAYAAYVDKSMDERVVETAWLSDDIEQLPRWMKQRPVYIVYLPWGDLPAGYRLQRLAGGYPPVYRVLQSRR